jgi:hypothetical protein
MTPILALNLICLALIVLWPSRQWDWRGIVGDVK